MKKPPKSRTNAAPRGRDMAANLQRPARPKRKPEGGAAASERAQERRDEILDAAEELLCTEGYAALSLRAVARAAEMRVGNLQYYFPAHSDLIGALLRRNFARAEAATRALLGDGAAPLSDILDWLLADQKNPRSVRFFYEMWALAAHNEAASAELRKFYQNYAEAVAARTVEPASLLRARIAIALLEGASLFQSGAAGEPDAEFERALKRLALNLLAGKQAI